MQYDVYGNLLGLLGAHPVAPLVSLHHLDVVDPIFPGLSRVEGLKKLFESAELDSASIIQQSFCYDKKNYWSISLSWGYVVQVMRGIISPRELEMPTRTFLNWYKRADYTAYAFNTRPVARHPCQKPFLFYLTSVKYDDKRNQIIGVYSRIKEPHPYCRWKSESPDKLNSIVVLKRSDSSRWERVSSYLYACKFKFIFWILCCASFHTRGSRSLLYQQFPPFQLNCRFREKKL